MSLFIFNVNSNLSVRSNNYLIDTTHFFTKALKGAVCFDSTKAYKYHNMQIFKKHAKLTYFFFSKTMQQSIILLWKCAFWTRMLVSVLVYETRPLPVYPIVFWHPGLPVGEKHSVFHFIHRHVRLFLLVSLIWQPECVSSLRGRGRIWTAIPSSTAMCQS